MAQFPKTTRKSSCFPSFFRFSGNFSHTKTSDPPRSDGRKKSSCFCWPRFRIKKSGIKTVPVDAGLPEKINTNEEIQLEKSQISGSEGTSPVAPEKPAKTKCGAQNINLENGKILDHLDSSKVTTKCRRRKKLEPKRGRPSQPASPENTSTTTITGPISRSISLPPGRGHIQKVSCYEKSSNNENIARRYDTMFGLTIIMVTLVIMVIWGKLFAILCTSAWFYLIPYFRSGSKSNEIVNNSNFDDKNPSSEQLKKKVILEGLLERNHRSPFGIL